MKFLVVATALVLSFIAVANASRRLRSRIPPKLQFGVGSRPLAALQRYACSYLQAAEICMKLTSDKSSDSVVVA
ncbi:hypothetical protein NECAME_05318 [Necator americanus]|uniref:Secreted protein n=1 Tax=Necator americanus TaxID=51031 RepID=W2SI10_NECAM|nr:hypothetical protein NECAME_05318 [Necator americanus]ETN69213.1 hypothetical protein NECAME_05318 [Necator americanus]